MKEISLHFKIFNIRVFVLYAKNGLGFFRVFGIGLHWKDTTKHKLYFSERNNITKTLKIGTFRISFLGKN